MKLELIKLKINLWNYKNNEMELIEKDVDVLLSHDSGIYSMSMLKEGGPILSNRNLDKLKENFKEALNVSTSVRNLMYFKETMKVK